MRLADFYVGLAVALALGVLALGLRPAPIPPPAAQPPLPPMAPVESLFESGSLGVPIEAP